MSAYEIHMYLPDLKHSSTFVALYLHSRLCSRCGGHEI